MEVYEDKELTNLVVSVQQKSNRCFPLKFNFEKQFALKTSILQDSVTWHRRFGHLNYKSQEHGYGTT